MNGIAAFFSLTFLMGGLGAGIVSFVSNYWEELDDSHYGFFQTCKNYFDPPVLLCSNNLDEEFRDYYTDNDWYLASLGSHMGGIVFGVISIVFMNMAFCTVNTGVRGAAIVSALLSMGGFLCSIMFWKYKYTEDSGFDAGWAFWCAVGAVGSTGLAFILLIVTFSIRRKKRRYVQRKSDAESKETYLEEEEDGEEMYVNARR